MKQRLSHGFLLLAMLVVSDRAFGAMVINFDDLLLVDGGAIPQTYGDNALFDVSYRELESFGNGSVVNNNLAFWTFGYGTLQNVAWGSDPIESRIGEIRFDSLSTNPVVLTSFDAAGYDGFTAENQALRVYDGSYNLLFALSDFDVNHVTHDTINPNASSGTLILQWSNPWGVAIDNISITAVPEPSSLGMFGLCFGCFVLWRRRITMR